MRHTAIMWWSRFHTWPPSLLEALAGAPVPADLQREADAARIVEQLRQQERDARPSGLLEEEEVESGYR
jgi:hypothetical protein